jgi:hypothetical protein
MELPGLNRGGNPRLFPLEFHPFWTYVGRPEYYLNWQQNRAYCCGFP